MKLEAQLNNNVVVIAHDSINALPPKVRKAMTCHAPGYKYTWKFKRKIWDGTVSSLKQISQHRTQIPTGLLPRLLEVHPDIQLSDFRYESETFRKFKTTDVRLRDYQIDCINTALTNEVAGTWFPRGVIEVATGGGKTEIAVAIRQLLSLLPTQSTLFLVHRKDLMYQAAERFRKYGFKTGLTGDGRFDQMISNFEHGVNFATIQSVQSEYSNIDLQRVDCVFFDEAHLISADLDKGNVFTEVSEKMSNAFFRFGLTATPFMRDEYSNRLLEAATGPSLFKINNRTLIDLGYLTEAKVTMHKSPPIPNVPNKWPECYDFGIVMNAGRNLKIVQEMKNLPGPMLVMVQREQHGKALESLCAKHGLKNVPFVYGKDDSEIRRMAIDDLRTGRSKAVICSTIWDEGLDIPELQTIILAGGGKSMVKNLQRLGRGLRLHDRKATLNVVDFFDQNRRWLIQHSRIRQKIWEDQGFNVEIV